MFTITSNQINNYDAFKLAEEVKRAASVTARRISYVEAGFDHWTLADAEKWEDRFIALVEESRRRDWTNEMERAFNLFGAKGLVA